MLEIGVLLLAQYLVLEAVSEIAPIEMLAIAREPALKIDAIGVAYRDDRGDAYFAQAAGHRQEILDGLERGRALGTKRSAKASLG
jgi:hypothetical protein